MSEGTQSRIEHRQGEAKQPKSPKRLTDSGSGLEIIRRDLAALRESAEAKRTAGKSGDLPKLNPSASGEFLRRMKELLKRESEDFNRGNGDARAVAEQNKQNLDAVAETRGINLNTIPDLSENDQAIQSIYNEASGNFHATVDELGALLASEEEG